jgi:hypothetical protein
VAVHANVHVPPLHEPPELAQAAGSQTFPTALSVSEPSVLLASRASRASGPGCASFAVSPEGASPASVDLMSSRSSIPRTAAQAATPIIAPQSAASRPARTTTFERVRVATLYDYHDYPDALRDAGSNHTRAAGCPTSSARRAAIVRGIRCPFARTIAVRRPPYTHPVSRPVAHGWSWSPGAALCPNTICGGPA